MPFKSEKQRRYLWANEPEIARDWTDTYGSRIQKDEGGIMRRRYFSGAYGQGAGDRGGDPHASRSENIRAGKAPERGPAHLSHNAPATVYTPKPKISTGEKINQWANKTIPGRQTTNEAMRNKFLTQYMLDDPSRRNKLIEMGLLGGDEEGWIGDITSLKSLEALKGLENGYTGGYHDVNDPGHPDYDPRGGGEGEQPWLYPQGGIASVDDTITQTASTDPSNLYAGAYRVRPEFLIAEGGRVPAAFGGIMDSETGRRGYFGGSFNPFKAVKKAVKSGIKGVKKLAKTKLGKMALAYLATAGASNYLAGAQGSFGLGAPQGQAWKSMNWLKPEMLGQNIGTSWDKAASLLSPGKPHSIPGGLNATDLANVTKNVPWYKDPWKVLPAGMAVSGVMADKMPADEVGGVEEDYNEELAKWEEILRPYKGKYRVQDEFLLSAEGGRVGRQEGGLMNLGGMEKDYRNDGGFVPLGGEEKADDVPARLSRNEFVFTADAVRNAGGGDIDKGAEVMENVMKNLEAGGRVSEESQGKGAQDMFEVSERLSEVV